MRGLSNVLTLFCNGFNKFNKIGARMLDSLCHMTLSLIENRGFGVKTLRFCHI